MHTDRSFALAAIACLALILSACESKSPTESSNRQAPITPSRNMVIGGGGMTVDTIHTGTSFVIQFSDGNTLSFVTTGQGVIVAGKAQGVVSNLAFASDGQASIGATSFLAATDKLGFFGSTGQTVQQSVTGSRGNNAALAQLLAKLHNLGIVTNNTTN